MQRDDVDIIETTLLSNGFYPLKACRLRYRLFSGAWSKMITRELLEPSPVAGILPYDPILDKIVLIEQFRLGALEQTTGSTGSPWLLEIVAGMIEADETVIEMAHRETQEEAGLTIQQLIPITQYWASPGGSTEKVYLFCARVDASNAGGIHGVATEQEDIRVHVFSPQQLFADVAAGIINNAMIIIALQWFQLHYQQVRKEFS